MDIKQLRYFAQVCADGSILQASRKLYISQQALSKAIATMEDEVGEPLFLRTPKGLVLTETGTLLLLHSEQVIREMDSLLSDLAVNARRHGGTLKLGLAVGFTYLLPLDMLGRFSLRRGDLSLDTAEYSYDHCERLVESGQLDAAIVPGPVGNPNLETVTLAHLERSLLLRDDLLLAQKEEVTLRELRDQPFAVCMNDRCYQRFLALCKADGFAPHIVHHLSETMMMYDYCQSYGFLGICIQSFVRQHLRRYPRLRALRFAGGALSFPVVMVTRKKGRLPPGVKTLTGFVREIILQKV